MKKKQMLIGMAAGLCAVALTVAALYANPQTAQYLPALPSGEPTTAESTTPSGEDGVLDPNQMDTSIHEEDLHSIGETVTLELHPTIAPDDVTNYAYCLQEVDASRSPFYPVEELNFLPNWVTVDNAGNLISPHVYVQIILSVTNIRTKADNEYLPHNQTISLYQNGAIYGTQEMCGLRCLLHDDCIGWKGGMENVHPGEEHLLEMIFPVPEYWFTCGGRILFQPNHQGLDRYQLQMQGKREQYFETGLDFSGSGLEGVQPLAEEAIQGSGETVSDEAYTGLSYHIEGLTLSDVWEDGLTLLPEVEGEEHSAGYLYIDITLENRMGPSLALQNGEYIDYARFTPLGLPLYRRAEDGIWSSPLPPVACSAALQDGTLTLSSGEAVTLRLAYCLPEEYRGQALYLACSCFSDQAYTSETRAIFTDIDPQWIALDIGTLSVGGEN